MRSAVLLLAVVAMTLVPSAASLSDLDKPALVYAATNTRGETILGWTPVPFATSYLVYKGPDQDHLVLLDEVRAIFFHDTSPATDDIVYYGVSASFGGRESPVQILQTGTTSSSSCVATSGTQFEVYAQNCVGSGPS